MYNYNRNGSCTVISLFELLESCLSGHIRPSINHSSTINFYIIYILVLSELLDCPIYQKFVLLELFHVE